jgi:hypothetical protein
MATLPAKTLDLGDCDALDTNIGDGLSHVIQFEWLDDRGDHFHCDSPLD